MYRSLKEFIINVIKRKPLTCHYLLPGLNVCSQVFINPDASVLHEIIVMSTHSCSVGSLTETTYNSVSVVRVVIFFMAVMSQTFTII